MNTKTLANLYSQLSVEERCRLIVAAGDRGDQAEQKRLSNASKRITFSNVDYWPFAQALQEFAVLTFLDLADEAALYREAIERWHDAKTTGSARFPTRKRKRTFEEQAFEAFLAQGFVLRTKAAGWKLFCARMNISPFCFWKILPGFTRVQRELKIVEGTPDWPGAAYTPRGMTLWMNRNRPAGQPEVTEAKMRTAERIADAIDAGFRERVAWWGG